jgi:PEGA domain
MSLLGRSTVSILSALSILSMLTPVALAADHFTSAQQWILILSTPSGARIEVNNQYVGRAPLAVAVPAKNGYFTAETTIQAVPVQIGQYVQARHFPAGKCARHFVPGSTIVPKWIFFEMTVFPGEPILRFPPFT